MSYETTKTVNGVSTTTTGTWTVTTHNAGAVALSDGTLSVVYKVQNGAYIPQMEDKVVFVQAGFSPKITDFYSSATPFCPPPVVGESFEYTTFILGPAGRGGDYVVTTSKVRGRLGHRVTVPAGTFDATKITMSRTPDIPSIPEMSAATVTRYYVADIGVVKEVEEIPATNTTITKMLTTYSYQ